MGCCLIPMRMLQSKANRNTLAWCLLLALALGLKAALLLSSQSMADGDEAVTGIMAMHTLRDGEHRLYPYGVNYGAGSCVETHLAAVAFAVAGVSSITLKAVGLVLWISCTVVLYALVRTRYGDPSARLTTLLFAFSPQAAQWSLKVSGGHQVAVLLSLAALLCVWTHAPPLLTAALIPLVAFAHPIAAAFAVFVAGAAFLDLPKPQRPKYVAFLLLCGLVWTVLLWPRESTVWNPTPEQLSPGSLLKAVAGVAATLFRANQNARAADASAGQAVAVLWLLGFVAAAVRVRKDRALLLTAAAGCGTVLLVHPLLLVPRHVLLLYPFSCVVLARGAAAVKPKVRAWTMAALLVSGAGVQVAEMRSPCVYGADPQHVGLPRTEFRNVLAILRRHGVAHVYCTDPMLQWNIIFESQEQILARWYEAAGRCPHYVQAVDEARLAGKPVAVVGDCRDGNWVGWQKPAAILNPDPRVIETRFKRSPRVPNSPTQDVEHEKVRNGIPPTAAP